MLRYRLLPIALVLTASAAGISLPAQNSEDANGTHIKLTVPTPDPYEAVPFKVDSTPVNPSNSIEIRAASQMTEQDRNLVADAESTIHERAGFDSLGLNEGSWTYEQLVCPVFPNHLLLRFQRNNGAGDVSMFSISIPRSGEGRVRIIPILRRSYSLFSPAPINAMTISAFNHIRAEEQSDEKPDWVATGLCYAALAGANPEVATFPRDPDDQKFPAVMPPTLEIPVNGGAVVRLVNVDPHKMEWAMTFDPKGKLVKATHSGASIATAKGIPSETEAPKGRPLPDTLLELHGKPSR